MSEKGKLIYVTAKGVLTMKKFISVFAIILLISICFTSCEEATPSSIPSPQSTQSTEVTLSASNINEYLNISGQYGKIERETKIGVSFGYSDFTINIDPAVPGQFYNTSITLKVGLTHGWDVSSSDPAFSEKDGCLTTTIKLPANGSKEETHSLIASISYGNHNNQNVKIHIVSVSGTFVPA